mgnify:CR=1 FL=1
MKTFEIKKSFMLNGEPFKIISGAPKMKVPNLSKLTLEYFRSDEKGILLFIW